MVRIVLLYFFFSPHFWFGCTGYCDEIPLVESHLRRKMHLDHPFIVIVKDDRSNMSFQSLRTDHSKIAHISSFFSFFFITLIIILIIFISFLMVISAHNTYALLIFLQVSSTDKYHKLDPCALI